MYVGLFQRQDQEHVNINVANRPYQVLETHKINKNKEIRYPRIQALNHQPFSNLVMRDSEPGSLIEIMGFTRGNC
jgi:hypothetical protein